MSPIFKQPEFKWKEPGLAKLRLGLATLREGWYRLSAIALLSIAFPVSIVLWSATVPWSGYWVVALLTIFGMTAVIVLHLAVVMCLPEEIRFFESHLSVVHSTCISLHYTEIRECLLIEKHLGRRSEFLFSAVDPSGATRLRVLIPRTFDVEPLQRFLASKSLLLVATPDSKGRLGAA
jgi:hypothetical protein